METDRTETTNLADAEPQLVESLAREWQQWAERCSVKDWKRIGGEKWY